MRISPRKRRLERDRRRTMEGRKLVTSRRQRQFLRRSRLKQMVRGEKSRKARVSPHLWMKLDEWRNAPWSAAYERLYAEKGGIKGQFDFDIYFDCLMALRGSRAERAMKYRWQHYTVTKTGKLRYQPKAKSRRQR